jgi:hypothetical protein
MWQLIPNAEAARPSTVVPRANQSYSVSQRIRKRVEEIFGWMKTVGGFRKTRSKGTERTQLAAWWVGAAYNLVRMAKLAV